MTLDALYTKLNYYSGKDKRGKTFKITEFNALLPTVQDALYKAELDKLLVGDVQNIPESRLAITPLRVFKDDTSVNVEDGSFPLPADYRRYITLFTSDYRPIEVVTEDRYNRLRSSVMRRPNVRPFCYITSTDIMPCPTNIGNVQLQYFRAPTVPYYDYCQDANTLNEVYMPVGSYIRGTEDEPGVFAAPYNLYNSSGTLLYANVTKSGVSYPYTSQTVELEWEAIYHDHFVLAMLALVGINIQMNELTQYAEAKGNA